MVFANMVIVVTYLVIGKLYAHGLFHLIQLVYVPCCSQCHIPLALSCLQATTCCRTPGKYQLQKKKWSFVIILNVHCLCFVPCAPIPPGPCIGTCIRASVPFRNLLPSDARTNSIPGPPCDENKTVEVLILPLTQYVAALPKLF